MLRRVEPNVVSVFLALKHSRDVELIVYLQGAVVARGQAATLALGARLHAVVVTAAPLAAPLEPGRNYTYDVRLTVNAIHSAEDTDASAKTLASDGLAIPGSLLQGVLALGYEPNKLPSFALPPASLADLRLSHASCRKAHGPGRDALPTLDTIIRQTHLNAIERPHQLFLTGDQIYADDVAEPLLSELTAIGNLLLGWDEALPPRERGRAGPTDDELKPGKRKATLCPPFTSGESSSHLVRIGEFYAMYLFAWSDALWPQRFERRPEPNAVLKQYLGPNNPIDLYNEQCDSIEHFCNGLGKVRRALANVPVYMIFDDHEVTDDWYLHRLQRENILDSPLGRRIVTNSLSAYCVFQGWGNQPQDFLPSTLGGLFFSSLSQWRGKDDESSYATLLNSLGTINAGTPPALRFDYAVNGPSHQVIVMDSRTRRDYPPDGDEAAANLLGMDEIRRQIGERITARPGGAPPLTVLVSPAPVIGHPYPEWVQDAASSISLGRLATAVDREAWLVPQRRGCFEELLRTLVGGHSVLILSGDVHYAFSCGVRYWDERVQPVRRAAIVQLVSSSLKNQGPADKLAVLPPPLPHVFLGWSEPGKHIARDSDIGPIRVTVSGSPAVCSIKANERIVTPPQWRYRSVWLNDSRGYPYRGGPISVITTPTNFLAKQRALAQEHRRRTGHDQMRTVVADNNIATIRFAATPPNAPSPMLLVEHSIWYRMPDDPNGAKPFTVQWGNLTPPSETEPRPDGMGNVTTDPVDAAQWAELVSFRPNPELQRLVIGRQMQFQPIESGWGEEINLDHYPIRVRQMPTVGGVQQTAGSLLRYIREHLNDFIDLNCAEFRPFEDEDASLWSSPSPYGSVIDIDMRVGGTSVESGAVVVTDFAEDHWLFSTVYCERDAWHPVSGNRRFGYVADGNSWVFSTRGADRVSQFKFVYGSAMVFGGAHALWRSFQEAVELFINQNGGVAARETPTWARALWTVVKAGQHHPTQEWIN